MKIGVIGGGVWGSTLAKLLSNNKVFLFARDKKVIKSINEHHFNPKLKYAIFNDNITATDDLTLLNDSDYLFIALPSQSIGEVLSAFKSSNAKIQLKVKKLAYYLDHVFQMKFLKIYQLQLHLLQKIENLLIR